MQHCSRYLREGTLSLLVGGATPTSRRPAGNIRSNPFRVEGRSTFFSRVVQVVFTVLGSERERI